jgi:hypothetical protein
MAKYKAIITQRDGTRICLDLSCREYHANKLNYVLSRTLDRAIYMDAAVVACDALQGQADNLPIKNLKKEHQKYILGLNHETRNAQEKI